MTKRELKKIAKENGAELIFVHPENVRVYVEGILRCEGLPERLLKANGIDLPLFIEYLKSDDVFRQWGWNL